MPSPKDIHGPIVKNGPTAGENRSRNEDRQRKHSAVMQVKKKRSPLTSHHDISTFYDRIYFLNLYERVIKSHFLTLKMSGELFSLVTVPEKLQLL